MSSMIFAHAGRGSGVGEDLDAGQLGDADGDSLGVVLDEAFNGEEAVVDCRCRSPGDELRVGEAALETLPRSSS